MKAIMELFTRTHNFKRLSMRARSLLMELIAFGAVGNRVDCQEFLETVPWSASDFTEALNELVRSRYVVFWKARKSWCVVVGPGVEGVVPVKVAPLLARVPGFPRVMFAGTLQGSGSATFAPGKSQRTVTMKQIKQAFALWVHVTGRDAKRTKLNTERANAFKAMLKDYPESDVFLAIYGIALSPYHQGENEAGRRYDEPRVIKRNIEHFRDLALSQGMTPDRISEVVSQAMEVQND